MNTGRPRFTHLLIASQGTGGGPGTRPIVDRGRPTRLGVNPPVREADTASLALPAHLTLDDAMHGCNAQTRATCHDDPMVETATMSRPITPTIRRWQLGQELRLLRETARVEPKAAALEIGVSPSSLSRIETGKQAIRVQYVKLLALLYGADESAVARLVEMAEQAGQPEWYAALAGSAPDWFRQYLGYESAATDIRVCENVLVHGLLQTADYARAVIRAGRQTVTDAELDQAIELRRSRQGLAAQGGVSIHVVLDEASLHRLVGGRAIMRAQLHHAAELSDLSKVDLRVVPFSAGAHPAQTSPFTMLGFDFNPRMNTVYVENGRGALYLEGRADLDHYRWKFGRLVDLALTPEKTRDLLVSMASDL